MNTGPDDLAIILGQVLDGRRRLIGWGAGGGYAVARMICPLRPSVLVDGDPAKVGQEIDGVPVVSPDLLLDVDPDEVAILVTLADTPHQPSVLAAIDARGPFPAFAPVTAMELRALGLGHALDPEIEDDHQGRAWSPSIPPPGVPSPDLAVCLDRLDVGGSQRQMVMLAAGVARAGRRVELHVLQQAGKSAFRLGDVLASSGVRPRVLTDETDTPFPQRLAQAPEVLALIARGTANGALAIERFAAAWRAAPPAAILSALDPINTAAGLVALRCGVPRIVLSARSLAPDTFDNFRFGREPGYRAVYRSLARDSRVHLTANSQASAASYARWLELDPTRFTIVPNVIDPSFSEPPSRTDRARVRARLGVPADAPLVAGLFRLSAEKRSEDFLRVIARVRSRRTDVRAVIWGDGPERDAIAAWIASSGLGEVVALPGTLSDVRAGLSACDLLLHTSESEGFPNAVMEAQAMARPVVVARVGGTPEVVAPSLTGLMGAVGDIEALSEAVLAALASPDALRSRVEAARTHVLARHAEAAAVGALSGLLADHDQ